MSSITNPNWYKPTSIGKHKLSRIGIKLNKEILQVLKLRIEEAENTGRGVNILFQGDLEFDISMLEGNKGNEYKFNFTDCGNIIILPWDPKLAYDGSHKFWFEGFQSKEAFENEI